MALSDNTSNRGRDRDLGPDTTPGIPPSRPVPLADHPPVADTAFHPPERDGMSGLSIGLVAAVVVLGLYVLINWPWSRQPDTAVPEPAAASTGVSPAAAPSAPVAAGPSAEVASVAAPSTPATEGVHRCEKAGQVIYTDGPCPSGMQGHPVNTTTALSVEGEHGATLFRCRGAGQFWSIVHCQHRGAEVVSMHTVPANLPLAEQILFAQNRAALSRPARAPAPRTGPPSPPNAASIKAAECQRLDDEVAALDAYSRQPLSGGEQDRVRRDRKKARDEQFRLRCGR